MSELSVQFWGTRRSIPTPGRRAEKYGGTTAGVADVQNALPNDKIVLDGAK